MKRVIVFTIGAALLGTGLVFAQNAAQVQPPPKNTGQASTAAKSEVKLVEVGNKICPVSGSPVGKMGSAFKHEYKGKIYNLCCPMCAKTFDSDPAKYVKIAEDEAAGK